MLKHASIAADFVCTCLATGAGLLIANAASAQAPSGDQTVRLSEIVVTANKREQSIQDVPASITVLSGEQIEKTLPLSLVDWSGFVPGMSVTDNGSPGRTQVTFRGLTVDAITGALIGTYVDESPAGSSSASIRGNLYALDLLPYDVERLEVLRGPQGTLYGAGAMGGLLKYVLRDPNLEEFETRVGANVSAVSGASDLGWGARASLNAPLVQGKLGLRVSGFHQDTPGYIDDIGLGEEDYNSVTQEGGRLSLLWDATDTISIEASAMLQQIDAEGTSTELIDRATLRPAFGSHTDQSFVAQTFDQDAELLSLVLDWDLGFATLTSASSWQSVDTEELADLTVGFRPTIDALMLGTVPENISPFPSLRTLDKFSQELRLSSPTGGQFEWMLGAFYTDEDTDNVQDIFTFDMPGGTLIAGDFLAIPGLPVNPLLDSLVAWKYEEIAVFANATVNFNEKFSLTGGVRYAENEQDIVSNVAGSFIILTGTPSGALPVQFDESVTTWMLSPQWNITPDAMVYLRAATGYRPGGYSYSLTPTVPLTSESDEVTSYELGFKGTMVDGRLSVDAAVFSVDWENMQLEYIFPPPNPPFVSIANSGDSRSQGFELGIAYATTGGLRLRGTVAYVNAELTDPIPDVGAGATEGGESGDRLPLSPEWSGSIAADYQTALTNAVTLNVGAGYRYSGKIQSAVDGNPNLTIRETGNPVDAYVGLDFGRVTARLYARNLFDEEAKYIFIRNQAVATPAGLITVQPRTIGLSVDVTF